mmetsp:Transcript_8303/g.15401  ORF Transcript_8303/g.15401 Transcript_8303/m.15401 type:complete len:216 (+) Transcript_8303:106-753(+)
MLHSRGPHWPYFLPPGGAAAFFSSALPLPVAAAGGIAGPIFFLLATLLITPDPFAVVSSLSALPLFLDFSASSACLSFFISLLPLSFFSGFVSSCSKSLSSRRKFFLGLTTGLFCLRSMYASIRLIFSPFIKYARVIVADRLTPCWQWTRTPWPVSLALSMKSHASSKYCLMLAISESITGHLIYWNWGSPSKQLWQPPSDRITVQLTTCVTPSF